MPLLPNLFAPAVLAAAGILLAAPASAETKERPAAHRTQTPALKHAVSPASGKAKTTPKETVIPGSSTTGNATGPGGTASGTPAPNPADPTQTPPPR